MANDSLSPEITPLGLAAAFDCSLLDMALSIPALHEGDGWAYARKAYEGPGGIPCRQTFGEDPYLAARLSHAAAARFHSGGTPLDPDSVDGISRHAVSTGAVLLKNLKRALPITGIYFKKVAVLGLDSERVASALRESMPRVDWRESYWDAGGAADCDAVILCMGDTQPDGEARLPEDQLALLNALSAVDKTLIVAVRGLRPLALDRVSELASALLWIWQDKSFPEKTLARLLTGQESPSGRLPVTFPREPDESSAPVTSEGCTYLTMRREPLYPFGYGLSYAQFKYSRMRLSAELLSPGEGVTAVCRVVNTGQTGGYEVAQLYLRRERCTASGLPRWRLCRTARIYLQPGEEREISFNLPGSAFTTKGGKNTAQRFVLFLGGHQPDARSVWLSETPVLSAFLRAKGEPACL